MSLKSGLSEKEVARGFNGTKLMSLQDNALVSMNPKNTNSLFSSGEFASAFYTDRGVLTENPVISEIVEPKFVVDLYKKIQPLSD